MRYGRTYLVFSQSLAMKIDYLKDIVGVHIFVYCQLLKGAALISLCWRAKNFSRIFSIRKINKAFSATYLPDIKDFASRSPRKYFTSRFMRSMPFCFSPSTKEQSVCIGVTAHPFGSLPYWGIRHIILLPFFFNF